MLLMYVFILCIGSLLHGSAVEQVVERKKEFPSLRKLCARTLRAYVQNAPAAFAHSRMHEPLLAVEGGASYSKIAAHFLDATLKDHIGLRKHYCSHPSESGSKNVYIQYITATPDGRRLFLSAISSTERTGSIKRTRSICMYDAKCDTLSQVCKSAPVYSLACTDDGKQLIIASTRGVRIWHIADKVGQEINPSERVISAICTSDASRIYAIDGRYPGQVHELLHDVVQPAYKKYNANCVILSLAISADGRRIISLVHNNINESRSAGVFTLWDREHETSVVIAMHPCPMFGRDITCNSAASILFSSYNGINAYFDSNAFGRVTNLVADDGTMKFACADEGLRLFAGTNTGSLYEIYTRSKELRLIDHHGSAIDQVQCAADGSRIFFLSNGRLCMFTDYLADMRKLADSDTTLFQQLVCKLSERIRTGEQMEIDEQDPLCTLFERYPYLRSQFIITKTYTFAPSCSKVAEKPLKIVIEE